MRSEPIFSVIIPSRDRPDHLRRCLEGVDRLNFPKPSLEVVVADDGSRQPYSSTHAEYAHLLPLRFLRLDGMGPAAARNAAAAIARGRYLAFLDDDCVPAANWLEELLRGLERQPGCLAGGATVNAASDSICSEASQTLVHYLYDYFNRDPLRARFLVSCNMAVPKRDFEDIGGFDPAFPFAGGEDRDFCDRWLAAGRPLVYGSAAVAYHHHDLRLGSFLAQQARYGRGAFYFHQSCLKRGRRVRVEPGHFYTGLLRWPFQLHTGQSPLRRLAIAALLIASQAANVAGYLYEAARKPPRR